MWYWKRFPSKVWLVIPLLSLVFLTVACGAAAPPAPKAPEAVKPAAPAAQPVAPAAPAAAPKATAVPAPVTVPAAPKVHPGKLTIMVGDLSNERFDPLFAVGGHGGQTYGKIVHGFLISTNERLQKVPGIATKWGLSADGLTWTFTIRKGVKFHDGSELTPQDVLWTFSHYFGPQAAEYTTQSNSIVVSKAMDRMELRGPDEVSLTTKRPITQIPILVGEDASNWFPVLPKRATVHDTAEEAAYDRNPIGAGIMRFVKHIPASAMTFERFADYYYQPRNGFSEDKRVNFQSLELLHVPEVATRVAALRAGEADIAPASLATKKQVEAGGGRLVFGQEGQAVEARWIGCWETQLPCYDKRVRQALGYAIDKELIRDKLYGGPEVFQVKGWVGVTPSGIGYTPALDPWPFDPAKARQLLAEAGYPGGKGFGKLLVNTWAASSSPMQVEGAQLAAEFWKRELGLDVEVKVAEETGVKTRWYAGELNGQLMWRDDETRPDSTAWLNTAYGDLKTRNRRHQDPELVRVVLATTEILDSDKRAESSTKLFLRLRDESYQIAIGYVNVPWGVGPRVLTWRPYPMSGWVTALHTITLK
jgi:peptide/nickel transport system substrate-binding protein